MLSLAVPTPLLAVIYRFPKRIADLGEVGLAGTHQAVYCRAKMKLPSFGCCDADLKADQKVLATEGVIGMLGGITMMAHPKTAHVRNATAPFRKLHSAAMFLTITCVSS